MCPLSPKPALLENGATFDLEFQNIQNSVYLHAHVVKIGELFQHSMNESDS